VNKKIYNILRIINNMYDPQKAHYLVVTGILIKDNKFLITKRAPTEKAFPNQWTVPGGKLELDEIFTPYLFFPSFHPPAAHPFFCWGKNFPSPILCMGRSANMH